MSLWTATDNNAGKPKFDSGADVFGVDTTEASAGVDNVVSVAINTGGTGYSAGALVVDNTGSGGPGFAGTFTVSGGVINAVTITNAGSGYTSAPSISGDVGGSGGSLVGALGTGNHTHAGWVKRTVGTGGRAGRVQYETLVAMSSITSDASDDTEFPDA